MAQGHAVSRAKDVTQQVSLSITLKCSDALIERRMAHKQPGKALFETARYAKGG